MCDVRKSTDKGENALQVKQFAAKMSFQRKSDFSRFRFSPTSKFNEKHFESDHLPFVLICHSALLQSGLESFK